MDPNPCGRDTDPLDYINILKKCEKRGGVLVTISMECGGILLSLDPDPQRIRTQPLNTKQLLNKFYVLLVWWGSDRGSAVGWSSCFYVHTNSVSRIRNLFPLYSKQFSEAQIKEKRNNQFRNSSKLVWWHAYCGACLLPRPRFCYNLLSPMPPIYFRQKEGGAMLSLNTRSL